MLERMHIPNQQNTHSPIGVSRVLFALGFRPFFLFASIAAVMLLLVWLMTWHGALALNDYHDPVAWHAHEMLFGYAVAVIAGFLLTAVPNWTGIATWKGKKLGLLVAVWLAGRLAPWLPGMSPLWITGVDLVFLPLLAVSLVKPLWLGQNRVNRVFVALILVMALTNLMSHLQLQGLLGDVGDARRVMLDLVVLLLVLVSGRVLPFFTRSVLPGFEPRTRQWVERASFAILLALIVVEAASSGPGVVAATFWLAFAVVQAVRFAGWTERRVWRLPVLWVLHAGYAWLILGALLQALAQIGEFPPTAALHALGIGAIGVFTLGMMARVTRGHTGRSIEVGKPMALGFVLLNAAALLRVFGPAWLPGAHNLWVDLSGGLWIGAFGIFAVRYGPRLLRPRVDGKPG
jgi:uncharacterized protein involved in response to NO